MWLASHTATASGVPAATMLPPLAPPCGPRPLALCPISTVSNG
ncbi:MAG: hypothetical protein ACK5TK_11800 [Betaproteobacteria bacterium]